MFESGCLSLLSFSFLYILDINHLSDRWFANISPIHELPFYSLAGVLWNTDISNFDEYQLVYFFLLTLLLMSHLRDHCQIQCLKLLVCFLLSFRVLNVRFRSLNPFWDSFCVWWWARVTLYSFCMWISSFPMINCWKDCLFSFEWSWHPCWKQLDHVCESLFLRSLVHCSVCPYTNTTLFWLL